MGTHCANKFTHSKNRQYLLVCLAVQSRQNLADRWPAPIQTTASSLHLTTGSLAGGGVNECLLKQILGNSAWNDRRLFRAFAEADSRNRCLCAVLVCRYHCKSVGRLLFPQVSAGQKSQSCPRTHCARNRHYLGATHLVDHCCSHLSHYRSDQGIRNWNGCDRVCI